MPTHDYIIANGTGAAVRADINLALSAIVSLNSSASEPATMYAYQLWADTAAGLLKIRNGANSAWVTLRQLDGDFSIVAVEDGLQATPSLTFTNDLNTGVFRSGADALAIVTGGQYAITCTSTQAVGIRTPNPSTALHVAGNARVGADDVTDAVLEIGAGASGNRTSYIDIVADTTYTDYGLRVIRNNTGANATSELKHRGTGALNFTTQEAAPIVFNTTNSPALTITSGGLVGIGTSGPTSTLHIQHAAQTTNYWEGKGLLIHEDATANQGIAFYSRGVNEQYIASLTDDAASYLIIGTRKSSSTNNVDALTIRGDGKVGIGTTSPSAILDVVGSHATNLSSLFLRNTSATNTATTLSFYSYINYNGGITGAGSEISAETTTATDTGTSQMVFKTTSNITYLGPQEKMRLDASGRLLVGTSTSLNSNALLQVYKASGGLISIVDSDSLSDGESASFRVSGGTAIGELGAYKHSGIASPCIFLDIQAQDGASNYYWTDNSDIFRTSTNAANIGTTGGTVVGTQSSDERIKDILGPVEYGLDILKQIEPVRYTLKTEPDTEKLGFIAQQVQPLVPQSVFDTKEYIEGEPEDAPTKLGMEYVALLPVLVNAIKELSAKNDALEARLAALESA